MFDYDEKLERVVDILIDKNSDRVVKIADIKEILKERYSEDEVSKVDFNNQYLKMNGVTLEKGVLTIKSSKKTANNLLDIWYDDLKEEIDDILNESTYAMKYNDFIIRIKNIKNNTINFAPYHHTILDEMMLVFIEKITKDQDLFVYIYEHNSIKYISNSKYMDDDILKKAIIDMIFKSGPLTLRQIVSKTLEDFKLAAFLYEDSKDKSSYSNEIIKEMLKDDVFIEVNDKYSLEPKNTLKIIDKSKKISDDEILDIIFFELYKAKKPVEVHKLICSLKDKYNIKKEYINKIINNEIKDHDTKLVRLTKADNVYYTIIDNIMMINPDDHEYFKSDIVQLISSSIKDGKSSIYDLTKSIEVFIEENYGFVDFKYVYAEAILISIIKGRLLSKNNLKDITIILSDDIRLLSEDVKDRNKPHEDKQKNKKRKDTKKIKRIKKDLRNIKNNFIKNSDINKITIEDLIFMKDDDIKVYYKYMQLLNKIDKDINKLVSVNALNNEPNNEPNNVL